MAKKNKAKFIKTTNKEVKEIINSKMIEKIQRQKSYREAILIRKLKQVRLGYLSELLDKAVKEKKEMVEWEGIKRHVPIMIAEFNLDHHYYTISIGNENYLRQALKNDGLSDKRIKEIEGGKYDKEEEIKDKSDYIG